MNNQINGFGGVARVVPAVPASRILIVDDEQAQIVCLTGILRAHGYHDIEGLTNPLLALAACKERKPDLVVSDMHMPGLNGLALLKMIQDATPDEVYLPVLLITGDTSPETKRRALAIGAKDFLAKPYDPDELLLRIGNLLSTRAIYKKIESDNRRLDDSVQIQSRHVHDAQIEILQRLALAAEYRDDETGQHTRRVGMLAAMLARAAGQTPEMVERMWLAAPLHDIGKIGVPDRIFTKAGRLNAQEFEIMKSHTVIGGEILKDSRFPILQLAREIALSHHEQWDGSGYPHGYEGDMIPVSARITSLADVFDALTHVRSYKEAWPIDRAIDEIERGAGNRFDPDLVRLFLSELKAGRWERIEVEASAARRKPALSGVCQTF